MTFPTLSAKAVADCLQNLQMDFPAKLAFKAPEEHGESWRRCLEEACVEVCPVVESGEEISMPVSLQAVDETLAYPELHEESVPTIQFVRALQRMMRVCTIHDFAVLPDLHRTPTGVRMRRILSGIINFAKFREERTLLFDPLNDGAEALVTELKRGAEERQRAHRQLRELTEQTEEEAAQIEALTSECKEIENHVKELNYDQASIRQEASDLKLKNNQLKDEIAAAQLTLDEKQALRRRLQGQIVQSPARMRREMADAEKALEREQREVREAEATLRATTTEAERMDGLCGDVAYATDVIKALANELNKQAEAIAAVRQTAAEVDENQHTVDRLGEDKENCNAKLRRLEERLGHLQQQSRMRLQKGLDSMEESQKFLVNAESDKQDALAVADKQAAQNNRVEQQIELERQENAVELQEMVDTYRRLETSALTHLRAIQQAVSVGSS